MMVRAKVVSIALLLYSSAAVSLAHAHAEDTRQPVPARVDALLATLRKERRAPTADEQALIDDAEAAREVIIQVDSFPRLGAEISQPAAWTAEDRPALDALASSARSDQQFA